MTKTRKPSRRITSRVVDTKRHTTGYVIGKRTYSVSQVRNMAAKNEVFGVRVVGQHIQALQGRKRLSDLPVVIRR